MFRQIKILALFIAIISSAPEETAKSAAGIFATTLAKACVSATGIDPSGSAVPTSLPTPTATASAATAEATQIYLLVRVIQSFVLLLMNR